MRARESGTSHTSASENLPVLHGETVARIVELLRNDILGHKLAPGDRLVEHDLTDRFGVSRGPVREALRRLAAEGLIEHSPNRGAQVRKLSAEEVRELFEIRIELEGLAARLAAASVDEERRAAFFEAVSPIYQDDARASPTYLEENTRFHEAVMDLAGNRQLGVLAARLQLTLLMGQVGEILTPSVLEDSVREHRALAQAIRDRDMLGADTILRAHLGRAEKLALAHIAD